METDEARGEESTALMERKREQERRRRAALVGQIDMNAQSDMMASFEEMIHSWLSHHPYSVSTVIHTLQV